MQMMFSRICECISYNQIGVGEKVLPATQCYLFKVAILEYAGNIIAVSPYVSIFSHVIVASDRQ